MSVTHGETATRKTLLHTFTPSTFPAFEMKKLDIAGIV